MPLSAGDKLGAYEIVAQISVGGMGEVYRAKDTKLGRQVAIKVLPGHLAADTSTRERLRCEAVAAAALLTQAERFGHAGAVWIAKWLGAWLSAARGDLTAAGKEAEDAWNFGETQQNPWNFIPDTLRGQLAFLRGNFAEAERWFRHRPEIEMKTFFSGWTDSCLFAALAETKDDRAWKAWTDRRWKLLLIGQPNHVGAWIALERSVIGLAWLDRRAQVAAALSE